MVYDSHFSNVFAIEVPFYQLQNAGNEAFHSGKHAEAVEHYTAALSCNVVSRPFAAICFCNRSAAYKALGQISDAIADCSLAIALDGEYLKVCLQNDIIFMAPLHDLANQGLGGVI